MIQPDSHHKRPAPNDSASPADPALFDILDSLPFGVVVLTEDCLI